MRSSYLVILATCVLGTKDPSFHGRGGREKRVQSTKHEGKEEREKKRRKKPAHGELFRFNLIIFAAFSFSTNVSVYKMPYSGYQENKTEILPHELQSRHGFNL